MKKIFKYIWLVIFTTIIGINNVNATGKFTISLSNSNISKGQTVTLYIKAIDCGGKFNITSSNSTVAGVSENYAFIDNNTYTIKINALNNGTTTITVNPTDVTDYDNKTVTGSKTLTLNVISSSNSNRNNNTNNQTNEKKSNDATLKSLSIDNVDISPVFKSNVTEYTASADSNIEKIKIDATTNDSKSVVSGTGEISVSEGVNNLEVIVSAEDGSTKKYTIKLTVEEKNPIKVKIDGKEYIVVKRESNLPEVDLFEKSDVEIGSDKVPGYYNDKLNVYLIALKDADGKIGLYVYDSKKEKYVEYKWITVGDVTLQLLEPSSKLNGYKIYKEKIKEQDVEIYKIKKNSEFGLIYGVNIVTGNKGYYLYDKIESTLSRYYDEEVNFYKEKIKENEKNVVICGGVLCGILIIVVTISLLNSKKRR